MKCDWENLDRIGSCIKPLKCKNCGKEAMYFYPPGIIVGYEEDCQFRKLNNDELGYINNDELGYHKQGELKPGETINSYI